METSELRNYNVILETHQIGQRNSIIASKLTRSEAVEMSKKLRKSLTKFDKNYYGMKYLSVRDDRVKKFIKDE